jgi:His/Glu/Gln/Arg/opine family amino acid ABC transporter permease subunit
MPLLLQGAKTTLCIFMLSSCISLSLGLVLGVLASDELKVPVLSRLVQTAAFILRAVPLFVQVLIVYFVLPDALGMNLEPLAASIFALSLCSSGYVCQIVRCGLNSLAKTQWEAAFVLGYTRVQSLRCVILPQMMRNTLLAFNNELESLLKSTAILSSIGVLELTRMGMNIISREMQPLPIYFAVAVFYVALSILLRFGMAILKKKVAL